VSEKIKYLHLLQQTNAKKMTKLMFIVVFMIFIGCDEKKVVSISKKNILKDSVKRTFFANKVLDSTYQKQQFDSLLDKFHHKNVRRLDLEKDTCLRNYGNKCNFYQISYKDALLLNLCSLYNNLPEKAKYYECNKDDYPSNLCYSTSKLRNNMIGITVLQAGDGWLTLYYLTYKNRKLVSYTTYPFYISGSDIGIIDNCITNTINDSTFFTIDKKKYIDKNGIIKQNRKVFIDKQP
jgi:hypothetical protein